MKSAFYKDAVLLVASLALLSSCAKEPDKTSSKDHETKQEDNLKNASSSENAGEKASSEKDGAEKAESGKEKGSDKDSSAKAGGTDLTDLGKVNINLADLASDLPICSVGGNEIKVGQYKHMLRIKQTQANQAIVLDPGTKAGLLAEAEKRGISLNALEKSKLLDAARQQKGADPKEFQSFLKQTNTTEQQFDQEVLKTGLAFKVSNALIESSLLPELVNRELLAQAANESGAEKTAMNKYLSFKNTQAFDQLKQQTGLSQDSLKEEIVKAEMAKLQLEKLESQVKVTDADVKKLYDANKEQFKHGDRIKLSTILILCPEKDIGPIGSVKTQLKKAKPDLSEKELDAQVAQYKEAAAQKCGELLGQLKAGADFAKLANENSNDPLTVQKKNGGDAGFIEKKDLVPALADALWKLKPGELLKQTVKSDLGYTIYKVTGKEGAGYLKYDDIKDKLQLLAKQAKLQDYLAQWLDKRKKTVRVEFTPKFLAIAQEAKSQTGKTQ